MEKKKIDYSTIPGWGIDANPQDHPNWPMKNYNGDDHKRSNWTRPTLQEETVELLRSTERPNNPAVFGTPQPPRGLSGMIRRFAFRYSENMYRHWLPLLLADRVDVIEGMIEDLINGKMPRPVAERGWGALWKHKPSLLARKVFVRLAVLAAIATPVVLKVKKRRMAFA